MKVILYLLIACNALMINAQTVKEITGKWKFYTIITQDGLGSDKSSAGTQLLGSLSMDLNADKSYTSELLGINEKGDWDLKEKDLVFTTNEGITYGYAIIDFKNDLLTLDFRKKTIVLSRECANLPPPPHLKTFPKPVPVKSTESKLIKKWYLKQRPAPENLSENQKEAFAEMLSGSFIEFGPKGKCTAKFGTKTEKGNWTVETTSEGLSTTVSIYPKQLLFLKVTPDALTMLDPISGGQWIFSVYE